LSFWRTREHYLTRLNTFKSFTSLINSRNRAREARTFYTPDAVPYRLLHTNRELMAECRCDHEYMYNRSVITINLLHL